MLKSILYWTYILLIIIATFFFPIAILLGNLPLGRVDAIIGAILSFIFMASYTLYSFQLERTN
ncbi:hypothetical protein [Tepidibacillus fermentans]|uniref:Uncharacterized protein n=1 Tax=Tepidibacillus fermentans TaxID=1281767 RepID=A0A4R3KI03_9BACI|nr:hypothetical protein [Tepidibacillus fermentans]TCS83125.1 hypothetical protein EDD72_10651 [Tepidibacillus fermentans]